MLKSTLCRSSKSLKKDHSEPLVIRDILRVLPDYFKSSVKDKIAADTKGDTKGSASTEKKSDKKWGLLDEIIQVEIQDKIYMLKKILADDKSRVLIYTERAPCTKGCKIMLKEIFGEAWEKHCFYSVEFPAKIAEETREARNKKVTRELIQELLEVCRFKLGIKSNLLLDSAHATEEGKSTLTASGSAGSAADYPQATAISASSTGLQASLSREAAPGKPDPAIESKPRQVQETSTVRKGQQQSVSRPKRSSIGLQHQSAQDSQSASSSAPKLEGAPPMQSPPRAEEPSIIGEEPRLLQKSDSILSAQSTTPVESLSSPKREGVGTGAGAGQRDQIASIRNDKGQIVQQIRGTLKTAQPHVTSNSPAKKPGKS